MGEQKRSVLLRLNLPFCEAGCDFCPRRVVGGRDPKRLHACVSAIERELCANADDFSDCRIEAVRIGGGNATALTGEDLWALYVCIAEQYDLAPGAPVTISASPFQISGARLAFSNRIPITRYDYELLSLSADDTWTGLPDLREKLRIAAAMTHADQNGSMGAELLLGHPEQSPGSLHGSIVQLLRGPMVHLTLRRHPAAGEAGLPPRDRACLTQAGFFEYLPLRWARPGHADRYACLRRAGTDELAFGPGARTHFGGAVSENTMDIDRYLAHSNDYALITEKAWPEARPACSYPYELPK